MAIVQDVLECYELAISPKKDTGTKRTIDNIEIPPSKRRKCLNNTILVDAEDQSAEYREVSTLYCRLL